MNKEQFEAENAKKRNEYLESLKDLVPTLETAETAVLLVRHKGGQKRTVVFGDLNEVILLLGANMMKSPELCAMIKSSYDMKEMCGFGEMMLTEREKKEMAETVASKADNEHNAG